MRGWWPRLITNALRAELGPVLLFAPRRHAAEELARELAAALPPDAPLPLTREQEQLAGPRLARLLQRAWRIITAGSRYAQRAGLIEPLAKAGEFRVVVATMGLAAGINFSMRSVGITGHAYMAWNFQARCGPTNFCKCTAGQAGADSMTPASRW